MGSGPKTKADYDREIARAESTLAMWKQSYTFMKGHPENYTRQAIADEKMKVERAKGEVARLKALRRTAQ